MVLFEISIEFRTSLFDYIHVKIVYKKLQHYLFSMLTIYYNLISLQ